MITLDYDQHHCIHSRFTGRLMKYECFLHCDFAQLNLIFSQRAYVCIIKTVTSGWALRVPSLNNYIVRYLLKAHKNVACDPEVKPSTRTSQMKSNVSWYTGLNPSMGYNLWVFVICKVKICSDSDQFPQRLMLLQLVSNDHWSFVWYGAYIYTAACEGMFSHRALEHYLVVIYNQLADGTTFICEVPPMYVPCTPLLERTGIRALASCFCTVFSQNYACYKGTHYSTFSMW